MNDSDEPASLRAELDALRRERVELLSANERLGAQLARCQSVATRWEWFFENSIDLLCVCSLDGRFKRVNRAFEQTLGYTRDELLAKPVWDFIHPDDIERTRHEAASLASGVDSVNFENRYRHRDGSWRWLLWNCPAARDDDDRVHAVARDITVERRSEQEILLNAQHDLLTGLGNRALFDQALTLAMARVERAASREVALLRLDLDGCRAINEVWGERAGDHVRQVIAGRLGAKLRRIDVACRLGGDEFALIVEGFAPIQLEPLATKILKLVGEKVEWSEEALQVSGSIGFVTYPEPARNVADLLALADAAMYAARQAGANQYMRYDATRTQLPAWALNGSGNGK
jgi:diguanylate cyclase (GGDEF)-like protein/PAS domain S-box-containing protein